MPCRCDGAENDPLIKWRDRAHKATRAACDMRTILRKHKLEHELCLETIEWIKHHDRADAKRIKKERQAGERERAKQAALDKLTMDERRMLGL